MGQDKVAPVKTMTAWRKTQIYFHIFLTYAHYVKKSGQIQTMAALTRYPLTMMVDGPQNQAESFARAGVLAMHLSQPLDQSLRRLGYTCS